jgi:ribose transport system permease protein
MRKEQVSNIAKSYGTIFAGVAIILIFSILRPTSFATLSNFINITRQISLLVVIAIGATLIMSVEEFDLSIGALASLGGVLAAKLAVMGLPIPLCFILPLIIAFAIGYINGWIVTRFKVLSFITTLAMGTIIGGFTFWFTGGSTIFQDIPKSFTFIGSKTLLGMPLLSIIMVILIVIFWFIMRHTVFGRKLYAIGGNESASKVSGISVELNKNLAFAICAMMAAMTGVLIASRLGSAHPTGGDGFFLQAYAAAFLGRTVFKGGVPNIWGTFIGAAILGILANGLTIMQVPTFMQDILTGVIIIAAVVMQKMGSDSI